jgi:hypothetical protein
LKDVHVFDPAESIVFVKKGRLLQLELPPKVLEDKIVGSDCYLTLSFLVQDLEENLFDERGGCIATLVIHSK